MDKIDLSHLSSDVASTSSAAPLDVATPSPPRKHRTILDRPVSAEFTEVAQNSYDVFLCHRGPDTKATLVDVLRAFLQSKGVSCFVDYEMAEGVDFPPTLKQAIRNSKVHIIVLSPRFAESSWCLDEVQEIMELQKTSKASNHVLPIFFNVEPAHVRHQRRGSEYDLSQLHKKRTKNEIVRWSQALAGLADTNGFVYSTGRREGHMIEEIVSRVGKLLCKCLPLYSDSIWAGNKFQGQMMEEIVSRVDKCLWDSQHIGTEGEVEECGKRLAICWESNDVHKEFIDHLNESLTMHGLDVSELRGVDLLNWAYQKQADVILVILSRSFTDDSTLMQGLDKASKLCPEVKLVCIFYGLQSGGVGSVQSEIPSSTSHSMLSRSLSKRALQFPVDFQNTSRLDMVAFKSLINDIVLNHMQHEYKMYVTKFPVGLRKHLVELESQICDSISNRKVGTFGILGMGGIGKTMLAKSLYNRIYKEFEGAVFLHDVGTRAKESGLVSLQEAIVRVLKKAPVDPPIGNVEEGKALLTRRLHRTHILAILDDINHISQLDALFSPLDPGPGSVVVITTRDRSILDGANVNHVYEMDYLDQKDAKILFYWHAFLKPFPPIDLEMIAQKVIDACGCLPLSLEVIGAHVYNHNDPEFWEDTLVHLRNAGNEIFKKLRVSVDALENDQFKGFLDVCCFLIGEPYQTALRIWKGYGWAAVTCLDVLKSKCLITVDPNYSTIGMHDQIRDMGRYIANGCTPRTHIWDAKDASDIPQGGIDGLHGFAMIPQEKGEDSEYKEKKYMRVHCEASDLARLYRSKILLLHNLQIGGVFPKLRYDQIRWLQWQKSPFVSLPPGLYCSKLLRVLDLSDSEHLETLWGSSQSGKNEVPESLQELNLSGCFNLRKLPQFDVYLQNLEWLSLSQCKRLSHLHSSIGSLKKLKFLDLSGCSSLQSLPDTIEGLHSLEELHLWSCESLERLPEGIGRCRSLIEISLIQTGLMNLPESIGELRNWETLDLHCCQQLIALPDSVGALNMLRVCRLSGCERLQQLPKKFCELTSLIELDLSGCSSLRSLPDTIEGLRSLEKLDLSCCRQLVALPDSLGALNVLRVCCLSMCDRLQQFPEKFCELTSLIELDLSCCSSLRSLPDTIEGLYSLEKLNLRACGQLVALPDSLGALNMLRVCCLSGCERLQQLPEKFCELTSLTKLDLSYCSSLRSLPDTIEGLHSLKKLHVSYAKRLERLPESIGELRNLEKLDLNRRQKLVALPDSVGALHVLRVCCLSGCGSLQQLPEKFCELTSLTKLDVGYCDLENLPGRIGNLRNLRALSLRDNRRLRRLPASMGDLRSLTELDLRGCPLEDEGLLGELFRRLESLKEMKIGGAEIRSLDVSDNGQATFFPSSLRILKMKKCRNLERVSGLDRLKGLECFKLIGCDKLRYLNGLEGLESLQELDISLCRALDSSRFVADALGSAVRHLYIDESSVVPSMKLLQIPNLELLSCCGSELRGGFRDCSIRLSANYLGHLEGTIVIDLCDHDSGEQQIASRPSNFAAVLVSLLIPAGFCARHSDDRDYGIDVQLQVERRWSSQAKDQVILLIVRRGCEVLQRSQLSQPSSLVEPVGRAWQPSTNPVKEISKCTQVNKKIAINIQGSLEWSPRGLQVQASYIVVWGWLEKFNASFQDIS